MKSNLVNSPEIIDNDQEDSIYFDYGLLRAQVLKKVSNQAFRVDYKTLIKCLKWKPIDAFCLLLGMNPADNQCLEFLQGQLNDRWENLKRLAIDKGESSLYEWIRWGIENNLPVNDELLGSMKLDVNLLPHHLSGKSDPNMPQLIDAKRIESLIQFIAFLTKKSEEHNSKWPDSPIEFDKFAMRCSKKTLLKALKSWEISEVKDSKNRVWSKINSIEKSLWNIPARKDICGVVRAATQYEKNEEGKEIYFLKFGIKI